MAIELIRQNNNTIIIVSKLMKRAYSLMYSGLI